MLSVASNHNLHNSTYDPSYDIAHEILKLEKFRRALAIQSHFPWVVLTKNTEKNLYQNRARTFRIRFHRLLIEQHVRNAFTPCLVTHAYNVTLAYKIIGGPDGESLFSHRRSLPERFVSPDDPFKSTVSAFRIAMTIPSPWRKTSRGRDICMVLVLQFFCCSSFTGYRTCSKICNALLLLI